MICRPFPKFSIEQIIYLKNYFILNKFGPFFSNVHNDWSTIYLYFKYYFTGYSIVDTELIVTTSVPTLLDCDVLGSHVGRLTQISTEAEGQSFWDELKRTSISEEAPGFIRSLARVAAGGGHFEFVLW